MTLIKPQPVFAKWILVLGVLSLGITSTYLPVVAESTETIKLKTVTAPVGAEAQTLLLNRLIKEAQFGTPKTLVPLLEKGADPGMSSDNDQHSALTTALASDKMDNAYALLPYLNKNTFTTEQRSIFYAARRGDLKLLKQLINFTGHSKDNLLPAYSDATKCEIYQAIEYGHLEVAKYLLPLRDDCKDVLEPTIKSGQVKLLDWVVTQYPDLKERIKNEPEFMRLAVAMGKVPMVKRLETYGAKRDFVELAVEKGHVDVVRYFHEQGDSLLRAPTTLVQLAARSRVGETNEFNNDMVEYLLKLGIPSIPTPEQRAEESSCPTLANIAAEMVNYGLLFDAIGKEDKNLAKWHDPCNGNTLLHSAVISNDLDLVKYFGNANIDAQNKQGDTPLHLAVAQNNLAITQYLLDKSANEAITDLSGNTPLHRLLNEYGQPFTPNLFLLLINQSPAINIQNQQGITPLMLAAQKDNEFFMVNLLSNKADATFIDNEGKTALHYLINSSAQSIKNLELFINNGADLNAIDNQGTTLLHLAASRLYIKGTNPTILQQLIDAKVNLNNQDTNFTTPLIAAINNDQIDNALALINAGANINLAGTDQNSPLHYAAEKGNKLLIETLIKKGANLNALNKDGIPPAFLSKNSTTLEQFKEAGADLTITTPQGESIVTYLSSRSDKKAVLSMLSGVLNVQTNPNEKDKNGQTSLYRSIRYNSPDISAVLLANKVDPNAADELGNTPLHLAVRTRSLIHLNMLIKAGAKLDLPNQYGKTALHQSIEVIEPTLTNTLIQAKASINTRDNDQRTPLQSAIATGQVDLAQKLIELGADIYNRSKGDWTALHYAAQLGNENLVKTLLEKGAISNLKTWGNQLPIDLVPEDKASIKALLQPSTNNYTLLDQADPFGNTPLHQAVRDNNIERIKTLLSTNADVNAKNSYGETPLHTALHAAPHYLNNTAPVLELLLQAKADPLVLDATGRSTLELALNYQVSSDIVKLLLAPSLDKYLTTDKTKQTIANLLAQQSLPTLKFILPDLLKSTAVNKAAIWQWAMKRPDSKEVVTWLLSQGLDSNIEIDYYPNALSWALRYEYYDLLPLFIQAGNQYQTSDNDQRLLYTLLLNHKHKPAEYLLNQPNYKIDLSTIPKTARTLLTKATLLENDGLIITEKLLKAQLDDINKYSDVVNEAVRLNNVELLKTYQKAGFNYNNEENTKLIFSAAKANALEALQYLKEQGLDLNYRDENNTTIITQALEGRSLKVLSYLANIGIKPLARDSSQIFSTLQYNSPYVLHSDINEYDFTLAFAKLYPELALKPEHIDNILVDKKFDIANALIQVLKPKWSAKEYQALLQKTLQEYGATDTDFSLFDTIISFLPNLNLIEKPTTPNGSTNYLVTQQAGNIAFLNHLISKDYVFQTDELTELLSKVLSLNNERFEPIQETLQLITSQPAFKPNSTAFTSLANTYGEYANDDEAWIEQKYQFLLGLFNNQSAPSDTLPNVLSNTRLCAKYSNSILQHFNKINANDNWLATWINQKIETAKKDNINPDYTLPCFTNASIRTALINNPTLRSTVTQYGLGLTAPLLNDINTLKETITILKESGADIKAKDSSGNNLAYYWLQKIQSPEALPDGTTNSPDAGTWLQGITWLKDQGVEFNNISEDNNNLLTELLDNDSSSDLFNTTITLLARKILEIDGTLAKNNLADTTQPIHTIFKNKAISDADRLLLLQLLVSKGANINALTASSENLLMLAIENTKAQEDNPAKNDLINWLLTQKVSTTATNSLGQNALHLLVANGRFDLVLKLIQQGNAATALDKQGNNLLHYLARQTCDNNCTDYQTLVDELLAKFDINTSNQDGETPLILAAYWNNLEFTKQILAKKPDLNHLDKLGFNALHIAFEKRNIVIAEYLLEAGIDINQLTWDGANLNKYLEAKNSSALNQLVKVKYPNYPLSDVIKEQKPESSYWYNILKYHGEPVIKASKDIAIPYNYRSSIDSNNGLLHMAAQANQVDIIKKILDQNIAVDLTNSKRETPLQLAIKHKANNAIVTLMEKGAKPNFINQANDNAVLVAFNNNDPVVLKTLLDTAKRLKINLELNQRDEQGNTPLHKAVLNQNLVMAQLLIEAGADVNIYNNDSLTPLLLAVEKPNLEIVSALLKGKADLNAIDSEDRSALLHAIERFVNQDKLPTQADYKHINDLIDLLVNAGADLTAQSQKGNNALHISMGKYPVAHHLLTKAVDLKALNYEEETVLFQAARAKHNEADTKAMLSELIKRGIDINARNLYGETALQAAIRHENPNALFALLELGADPNVVKATELDDTGYNLPMYVLGSNYITESKKLPTLEYLAKAKVDFNHINANHENILFIALREYNNNLDYAQWLIGKGTKADVINLKGQSLLHILLEEYRYRSLTPKTIAQLKDFIIALKQKGLDINVRDMNSKTALQYAADNKLVEWIPLLLEQGANPNIQDNTDSVALSTIISASDLKGKVNLVSTLLQHQANPNLRNIYGLSSLHLAYADENKELIDILLKAGANPKLRSYQGVVPEEVHKMKPLKAKAAPDTKRLFEQSTEEPMKDAFDNVPSTEETSSETENSEVTNEEMSTEGFDEVPVEETVPQ